MLLTVLSWLILAPIALASGVFLTEVTLGLPGSARRKLVGTRTPSAVILMPAHNEAATIGGILAPLITALPAHVRLLVVADNCSDDTAAIARAADADVIERTHATDRGKGFALAFGREALHAAVPPEVVIVLDADCQMSGEDIAALAAIAVLRDAAVQARYTFHGDLTASAMVQVSNFALLVKNLVRQRGLARLGAPTLLAGTGMAFPWRVFENAPLANGDLVEDLTLTLALARAGDPPRYADALSVTSAASTAGGTLVQRTRWEHGFLDTAGKYAAPLLGYGLTRGKPALAWLGLNLMTPPLALLLTLYIAVLAVEAVLLPLGAPPAAFVTALVIGGLLGLAVLACWAVYGRKTLAAGTLLSLPLYMLWKIPMYLKFVRGREKNWVRSERVD